ncbi:MAG: SGNH/GDSL hydrolase family protein [Gemmatimonadales bacterium]
MSPTRREFIGVSAAVLASRPESVLRRTNVPKAAPVLLFQGDSITDCGRDRTVSAANDPRALGTGYPLLLAAQLRDQHPDRDLQVFNRGVSGNTVDDLRARWTHDTIDIKPAVLSILIGVNDKWHTLMGTYHGTADAYEAGYRSLIESTRAALPDTRLVIMEPFVLRTGVVKDDWFPDFDRYRAAARHVADGAKATFVPLHDMLQGLAHKAAPAYWLVDGVHPTVAGHAAIARQWMQKVKF